VANTLAELLAKPIPPTRYHAYPVIPVKGCVVIGAQPKSYKSFLAMNIAYDLAAGVSVLGRWTVDKPKVVLLIEQELGEYRLRERVEGLHGFRGDEIAAQNFYYASKDLVCKLDTTPGLAKIEKHIESCHPDVVIFDPLVWFHNQVENDNSCMQKVMEKIIGLQEKHGHSSIIVHHMSKPSEGRNGTDANSLRGASAVFGAVDSVVTIEKPVPNDQTIIRLNFVLRNTENLPPISLRLENKSKTFERIHS
jgi:RecA-family ATPase